MHKDNSAVQARIGAGTGWSKAKGGKWGTFAIPSEININLK